MNARAHVDVGGLRAVIPDLSELLGTSGRACPEAVAVHGLVRRSGRTPAPRAWPVGEVVAGAYRLEAAIGEGGMGKVYAAQHLRLPRRAAVKVLQPELAHTHDAFERFKREAEVASRLGGRNVVQVFDFGVLSDGAPYMLMELLEGESLSAHLHAQKRLRPAEVVALIDQAVAGLASAHAHGVVHRDVKPANMFLVREPDGRATLKLLDFGVSKARGPGPAITGHEALGTPAYMAPEQLLDSRQVDARADVYALAVTVFELLTGELPFDHPVPAVLCEQILTRDPRSLRSLRPGLGAPLEAALRHGLTKSRELRPATVEELWSILRPALLDAEERLPANESSAPPPREVEHTTRPDVPRVARDARTSRSRIRHGRRRLAAVAAIVAAMALGAGLGARQWRQERDASPRPVRAPAGIMVIHTAPTLAVPAARHARAPTAL